MKHKTIKNDFLLEFEQAIINVIAEYQFVLTEYEMIRVLNKLDKMLKLERSK